MNTQINKIKSNPIGAAAGALVAFYAAKKFAKVSNTYALIGITVAGVIAGAMTQSAITAKKGVPSAATIKK